MSEPKRCLKCNAPIALNQTLCHSCFTDEYLDEVMDGESWGSVPPYDEDDDDIEDWESDDD